MRHEMSKSALERHEVVSQIKCGALKGVEGARRLQISPRQMRRIVLRFEQGCVESPNSRRYGQKPGNVMSNTTRTLILTLIKDSYHGFGPTLTREKLAEVDGVHVTRFRSFF
jgi:hypothetical protein